jgi:hypothetical protein
LFTTQRIIPADLNLHENSCDNVKLWHEKCDVLRKKLYRNSESTFFIMVALYLFPLAVPAGRIILYSYSGRCTDWAGAKQEKYADIDLFSTNHFMVAEKSSPETVGI